MEDSTQPVTFSQAYALYEEHLRDEAKAAATILAYTKDVEQLGEYAQEQGKVLIDQINHDDIQQFQELLRKRRYTDKSISRKLNSIKSFFGFLVREAVLVTNPANEISHPKIDQQPPRFFSKMEYRALRDACRGDARIFAIVELLLQTGMRISELASLEMGDVDLERNIITIRAQQTRDSRKVPLNKPAKQALMDYLIVRPKAREKSLFLTKTCKPFLVRNIRSAVNRCFSLVGIKDATLNDLRNTFIVEQLKAGTPLVYVSQLVGHKRVTTTEKYLQLVEGELDNSPQVEIEEL